MFNSKLQANKPIIYYHQVLKDIKILLLYGNDDWNPLKHAQEVEKLLIVYS